MDAETGDGGTTSTSVPARLDEDAADGYGRPPQWLMDGATRLNPNAQPFVPRLAMNATADSAGQMVLPEIDHIRIAAAARSRRHKPVDGSVEQTLRDRLIDQLERENYECLICCQTVFANHWIWSCSKCFHIFHFHRNPQISCITKWAAKSVDEDGGWRCPSCQNINYQMPKQYRCFCGKEVQPRTRRGDQLSHSCGNTCGKERGFGCPHACTEPCHPGPCPPCPRTVQRQCLCGRLTKSIRCGSADEIQCSNVCDQMLNCGIHKCEETCHAGACNSCQHTVVHKCHCSSETKEVACTALNLRNTSYSCGRPCSNSYDCGVHHCQAKCHSGDCGPCPLSPERLVRCPCGKEKIKSLLDEARTTCQDAVPTCDQVCDKVLECGPPGNAHRCKSRCHVGLCPPCTGKTAVKCRCQASNKNIPCTEAIVYDDSNPLMCERRCKKMKSCKQHKCQEKCCLDNDHICLQVCGRKLNCNIHNCDQLCHVGQCPPCLQANFDEQRCLCGVTVREPPIPCGTPLPQCGEPCARQHACNHPITHPCHAEPECPLCTHLTSKWCYGRHELRRNIPCYLKDVSCGRPCQKALACGVHTCQRVCHQGPCVTDGDDGKCKQRCPVMRPECGHPCGQLCHGTNTECPKSDCASAVTVTCPCLRISARMCCSEVEKLWLKSEATKALQTQQANGVVRILQRQDSHSKFKCLSCDSECARLLRNKKLASALGLPEEDSVPVAGQQVPPSYTDFLKGLVHTNTQLVLEVENSLIQLVKDMEMQHHSTTRNHVFKPMGSDARRVVHEYAAYFRVETMSYDPEPHRNVVATAKRGQSSVPSVLLSALMQKSRSTAPSTIKSVWGTVTLGNDSNNDTGEMAVLATHMSVTRR